MASRVSEMPPESSAEEEILAAQDIQSVGLNMPVMDGFTAVHLICQDEAGRNQHIKSRRNQHLPIIAVTANAMPGIRVIVHPDWHGHALFQLLYFPLRDTGYAGQNLICIDRTLLIVIVL